MSFIYVLPSDCLSSLMPVARLVANTVSVKECVKRIEHAYLTHVSVLFPMISVVLSVSPMFFLEITRFYWGTMHDKDSSLLCCSHGEAGLAGL